MRFTFKSENNTKVISHIQPQGNATQEMGHQIKNKKSGTMQAQDSSMSNQALTQTHSDHRAQKVDLFVTASDT